MLVLTRSMNDEITIPSLELSLKVIRVTSGRVLLGIAAPRDVVIRRDEIAPDKTAGDDDASK